MADREVIELLDELRKDLNISYYDIAQTIGHRPTTIERFFTSDIKNKNECMAYMIADAMGLRTNRYYTCAGVLIDYYKNQVYYRKSEKDFIEQYRLLNMEEKNVISDIIQILIEKKLKLKDKTV